MALTETLSNSEPELPELATSRSPTASVATAVAATAERPIPASSGQRRLWFLEQMEPGSPLYNIPYLVRLSGALNPAALEQALAKLVERHEALRTNFIAPGSEPVQVIRMSWSLELPLTDLTAVAVTRQEEELTRLSIEEAKQSFNLQRDLMLRVRLFKLSDTSHALMLVMHHMASDGWSMAVIYRELGSCYEAVARGESPRLPEPQIHYSDFAEWQNEYLQGEHLGRLVSFWKKQIAGAPALLELPTDFPRPPLQSHRGACVALTLPADLVARIKQTSSQERVTLFMTLLAGFNVVLHRYSGQTDLVVGSPVAGRDAAETEDIVGFFVNTLLMRTDLSGDPTVKVLLARVRDMALAAFDHREMPYEKLVEELQPQRNLSFDPICQVYFALQNMPTAPLQLSGINLSIAPVYTGTAKSDLTVWAIERSSGELEITAEYALDLFCRERIQRFLGHFQTVLEGMVEKPDRRLSELPLLTGNERRQLLVEWNTTSAEYPKTKTLPELFVEQVARTPQATALVFDDQELTYAELDSRAEAVAAELRSHGVQAQTLVGVYVERSLAMMIGLLGIHKTGAAYVPLDPTYPKERIAFMLQDSEVPVLVTQLSLLAKLPAHQAAVICLDGERSAGVRERTETESLPSPAIAPDDLAYVLYTSGSTGNPKGVMVTHRNVVNFFAGMDHVLGTEPGVWLAVTSISFDISVLELFWTLTRGNKVVLLSDAAKLPGATASPAGNTPPAERKAMDFSLFYFASEDEAAAGGRYRLLLEGARFADTHGFKAVWTPERHFHSFGGLYPNPAVVGAAIAAVTERVQIRAGSCVTPLHHPARVAEEWSVVDNLSNGRVGISVANGWHDRDFALQPENFADRRAVMRQSMDIIRRLWRGESVSFTGGRGNQVPIKIYPRPIQSELPLWVTAAGSPETFKLAGETGVNVLTHLLGQELEDLAKKIQLYRQAWRDAGHAGEGCVTIALHTFVGDDVEAVKAKVKEPMIRYLADSADLLKGLSQAMYPGCEMKNLTAEETRGLVEFSFNRYFKLCGLLGTPETCRKTLAQLSRIGIDEVACLIDFGVDVESVLQSLEQLDGVRREFQAQMPSPADSVRATAGKRSVSLVEQMQRHRVTHLQCTPSFARILQASPETRVALKSLRQLIVGGEALPVGLARELNDDLPEKVVNMYGPTETTIWSTSSVVTAGESATGTVDIGRPLANQQAYILDVRLQPVPIGVPGELWIGGAGVARGYWRRSALTAEKFLADPFRPGQRMYRTGDLVRYRPDGVIDFLGRVDFQVKLRGHRIELGEIEAALMQRSDVQQAVVVLRADDLNEPQLVAYVVPVPAAEPAPNVLRDFLRQKLPEYMVPSLYVTLERLPLTPNGKVNRQALPAPQGIRMKSDGDYVAPTGNFEQSVAAIWKDILRVEQVGVDDNFFDFGGHSLQVVQVQNRLRETLGIDVPVLKLFQFPTIRLLAKFVAEHSSPVSGDESFRARLEERVRRRQGTLPIRRRGVSVNETR